MRRHRMSPAGAMTIACCAALFALPAAAAMYKWVDANGKVVYSDQPPPGNVKTEILPPVPPPANPNAAQELIDKELDLKQRDKKRAEDAKAADAKRQELNRKREFCANAMGQLRSLQSKDSVMYRYNDKGEKTYFDDEMRRTEAERQQQIVRENCAG